MIMISSSKQQTFSVHLRYSEDEVVSTNEQLGKYTTNTKSERIDYKCQCDYAKI